MAGRDGLFGCARPTRRGSSCCGSCSRSTRTRASSRAASGTIRCSARRSGACTACGHSAADGRTCRAPGHVRPADRVAARARARARDHARMRRAGSDAAGDRRALSGAAAPARARDAARLDTRARLPDDRSRGAARAAGRGRRGPAAPRARLRPVVARSRRARGLGSYRYGLVGDLGLVKLCSALRGRWVEVWETAELLEPYGEWAGLAGVYLMRGWSRGLVPGARSARPRRLARSRRA